MDGEVVSKSVPFDRDKFFSISLPRTKVEDKTALVEALFLPFYSTSLFSQVTFDRDKSWSIEMEDRSFSVEDILPVSSLFRFYSSLSLLFQIFHQLKQSLFPLLLKQSTMESSLSTIQPQ